MADDKVSKPEENAWGEGWEKVTDGYERGDSLREGPYINLSKNGAVEAGADATAIVLEISEARGMTQHQWAFDFHASESKGQVACVPIPLEQATRASAIVRWYEGKGSPRAAWHIGGVFKKHRALRPKSDVKCMVTKATGPDGLPVLVIPVKANLSTQTASRDSGGEATPGSQAAASEDSKA